MMVVIIFGGLVATYLVLNEEQDTSAPPFAGTATESSGAGANSDNSSIQYSKEEIEKAEKGLKRAAMCSNEISGICANASADMTTLVTCLVSHRAELSLNCQQALDEAAAEGLLDNI